MDLGRQTRGGQTPAATRHPPSPRGSLSSTAQIFTDSLGALARHMPTPPDPLKAAARVESVLGRGARRGLTIAVSFAALALTAACGSFTNAPPNEIAQPALPDLAAAETPDQPQSQGAIVGLRKHARLATRSAPAVAGAEPPQAARPEPAAAVTRLVAFETAPFPYDGFQPGRGPFLDVERGGQKGHRARSGVVLWENETFNDRRVLVHIPEGFDPAKPAVMVVFFHGFGATLARDVRDRQLVPAQVSASGANAVLVAPQFAVDARDGSAGHFWERGGFARFLDEASERLAALHGDASSASAFRRMPVALVAYSGGFLPAAYALRDIDHTGRVRGVMLLDAAYGELSTYARWAAKDRSNFFVSACTTSTFAQNAHLKQMLAASGVDYSSEPDQVGRGVTFFNTGSDYSHRDYVTQAWVKNPIKDLLARLPDVARRDIRMASWKDASNAQPARGRQGDELSDRDPSSALASR